MQMAVLETARNLANMRMPGHEFGQPGCPRWADDRMDFRKTKLRRSAEDDLGGTMRHASATLMGQ